MAATWLDKAESDVTTEERAGVKKLCYAIIYGMGTATLADDLDITSDEAEDLVLSFMQTFKGVSKFLRSHKRRSSVCGYVETILGRKRYLPHINNGTQAEKRRACRQAVNTLCQASAADIVKLAMVNIHRRILDLRCLSTHLAPFADPSQHLNPGDSSDETTECAPGCPHTLNGFVCRELLQVHDELLFEVRKDAIRFFASVIHWEMVNAVRLSVPLVVKCQVGAKWGSMQPLLLQPSSLESEGICSGKVAPVRVVGEGTQNMSRWSTQTLG
eukprot:GHVQ01000319.1.p1 GENE.GHVQ01000319.1~~GHVQ01000319.1.p1  ORF type:complete len:288 (-),score=25.13 GHVQ01000319.1:513-1328(-)